MNLGKTSGFCILPYKPQIPRESDLKATRRALYVKRLSIARCLQVNTSGEYIRRSEEEEVTCSGKE